MVHCPDRRYPIVLSVLLIGNRSQHAMHGMACWRFSLVLANNARLAQQCQLRREPSCCNLVLLCGRMEACSTDSCVSNGSTNFALHVCPTQCTVTPCASMPMKRNYITML